MLVQNFFLSFGQQRIASLFPSTISLLLCSEEPALLNDERVFSMSTDMFGRLFSRYVGFRQAGTSISLSKVIRKDGGGVSRGCFFFATVFLKEALAAIKMAADLNLFNGFNFIFNVDFQLAGKAFSVVVSMLKFLNTLKLNISV